MPLKVVSTAQPKRSANASSGAAASAQCTPWPAQSTGRRAAAMRSSARATAAGSGSVRCAGGTRVAAGPANAVSPFSSRSRAKSRCTGPGLPETAMRNASAIAADTSSGWRTWYDHFDTGASTATASACCASSQPMSRIVLLTVSATIGLESRSAAARPVARLVAPGPQVARHTPGCRRSRPHAAAAEAAPYSWRVATKRIGLSTSASFSDSVWPPGMPKIVSTPCVSRNATTCRAVSVFTFSAPWRRSRAARRCGSGPRSPRSGRRTRDARARRCGVARSRCGCPP